MKKIFLLLFFSILAAMAVNAQGGYTIKKYQVAVTVNKDASLDITETIMADFTEGRHGILRMIPFKYELTPLPAGTEKANRQLESNGYAQIIIEDINVEDREFSVANRGNYKEIKIGSKDEHVIGLQLY